MFGAFSFFFLLKVESETKCQPAIKERKKEKVKYYVVSFSIKKKKKSKTKKRLFMSFKITAGFFTLNKCKQLFTSVNVNTLGQSFRVYLKSAVQFCIFWHLKVNVL